MNHLPFHRIILRKHLCLFVLLNWSAFLFAQQSPEKVIFIGNSYTYFWNIPKLVEIMAQEKKLHLKTRQSTSGGVHLGMHWRGERDLQSRKKIQSGQFDAVVLQDHSLRAIDHPDSLLHYGKLFSDLARRHQAQPYFYMTWAREWNPLMQEQISKMYRKVAEENHAILIPVGEAWALARRLRPNISLHDPDGSHPSPLGAYLNACVFFKALTGVSPIGLPARLKSIDEKGDPLYLIIVNKNDARFCQEVAQKIVH